MHSNPIKLYFLAFKSNNNDSFSEHRHPEVGNWVITKDQESFLNATFGTNHFGEAIPDTYIEFYILEDSIPVFLRNVSLYLEIGSSITINYADGGQMKSSVTLKQEDSAGVGSRTTTVYQTYSFDNLFFRFYIYDYYGIAPFSSFIIIPTLIGVTLIYRKKRK